MSRWWIRNNRWTRWRELESIINWSASTARHQEEKSKRRRWRRYRVIDDFPLTEISGESAFLNRSSNRSGDRCAFLFYWNEIIGWGRNYAIAVNYQEPSNLPDLPRSEGGFRQVFNFVGNPISAFGNSNDRALRDVRLFADLHCASRAFSYLERS